MPKLWARRNADPLTIMPFAPVIRIARLLSGVVLLLFVIGHFLSLAADPVFRAGIAGQLGLAQSVRPAINRVELWVWGIYGLLVALSLACLGLRLLRDRRRLVTVRYDGGAVAQARRGLSLLEFSRLSDIPHAHVCGGRGRCGTCAVAVMAHGAALSVPTAQECAVLERIGAPAPGGRLACQALVCGDGVDVARLMPAYAGAEAARAPDIWSMPPSLPSSEPTSGSVP